MKKNMQTVKTIRAHGQWVKITRDGTARKFIFSRGTEGAFQAMESHSYPFEFMPTWQDAVEHAKGRMEAFK